MNTCPCNKCICVPICRLKQYQFLVQECSLIWKYLVTPFGFSQEQRSNGKLALLHKSLTPIMWSLFYDEYDRAVVDSYTGYEQCHFHY